jgi:3',5'-cyclic-AMP phosphodiesterase
VKILYANDLHASGPFPAHYPKTEIAVPKFFEMLRENPHGVERVVIGGDCVNRGGAEIDELRWMHDQLEATGVPYHVIAGNHDIAPSRVFAERYPGMEDMEECPLEETNFGQVFGEAGIRSVTPLGDWTLVMFSIRNEDTDGQVAWLQEKLSKLERIILVGHYPFIPSRNGGYCHEWGYSRIGAVIPQLTELINKNDTRVRAYFCGHQHINSRMPIGNAHQIVTGSVGLSTCCYRVLDIQADKIKVTTHRLDDISNWLGDAMNPDRSFDEDHPTFESYQWGNDNERTFEIHPA